MPYRTNADLPPSLRRNLPAPAQDIYREVFNRAYSDHFGDPHREHVAHRIALGAVKRPHVKGGDGWCALAEGNLVD